MSKLIGNDKKHKAKSKPVSDKTVKISANEFLKTDEDTVEKDSMILI